MALRKGEHKWFIPKPHSPGKWQLYNLALDPGETDDLADREPGRLEALIRDFQSYAAENQVIIQDAAMLDAWVANASERLETAR